MCACICVWISSRFIPFKALYCLSLGFPKSRCVGAVFDSSLHAQITVRTHPLDYKRAKLTGKKKGRNEKVSKRELQRECRSGRTCQKMWEKRDWCSCFGGGMQRRNIILQLSALTTTTHVFALWKKVLLCFLLGVRERERQKSESATVKCVSMMKQRQYIEQSSKKSTVLLGLLCERKIHTNLHSMNIWLSGSHWEDE